MVINEKIVCPATGAQSKTTATSEYGARIQGNNNASPPPPAAFLFHFIDVIVALLMMKVPHLNSM